MVRPFVTVGWAAPGLSCAMGKLKIRKLLHKVRGRGPRNATCAWCFYRGGKHGKTCTLEKPETEMVTSNDPACVAFSPFDGWKEDGS